MDSFNLVSLRSQGDIPPKVADLVDALGRLLFNCGLLESYSKNLIWELEANIPERIKLHNLQWKRRTSNLEKLINEKFPLENMKPKLIQALNDAREIMTFRNSVAHASLIECNDGEFVIVDSSLKKDIEKTGDFGIEGKIPLEQIYKKIDETADLVDHWGELWKDYKLKNPSND